MSAARKWKLVSVDEYLAMEASSSAKHEFVDGLVFPLVEAESERSTSKLPWKPWTLVSVEDYLAFDNTALTKCEYVDQHVYEIAKPTINYNVILNNLFAAADVRLRGREWRALDSNTRIRIRINDRVSFYHPSLSVIGRSHAGEFEFQDEPIAIFEIFSEETHRFAECQKKEAYLRIPSMCVYVLLDDKDPETIVYRRTNNGFVRELYGGLDAILPLREIDIELPLSEIYNGVNLKSQI